MVDRMDQGIGAPWRRSKHTGQFDNTLILFPTGQGGCAEATWAATGPVTKPPRAAQAPPVPSRASRRLPPSRINDP